MKSNKNKLILNDKLDQILANDFKINSHDSFDLVNIDFVLLNDTYIQITQTSEIKISIKYEEISNFSIQEANYVHK